MNEIAPFLSPLPQDSSLQSVNGRVRLPSLIPSFPFEGPQPFSIETDLPLLHHKDESNNDLESLSSNAASNATQISNSSNINNSPSDISASSATNKFNSNSDINLSQQRQIISFPRQSYNSINNVMYNNSKPILPRMQNNIIIEQPFNNAPLPANYQNFNNIQAIPPPIQQQVIIRSPADQLATSAVPNFSNTIINNNQMYVNTNQANSIFFHQQPQQIKLQDQQPAYQYFSPINSNIIKQPVGNSIYFSLLPSINHNSYHVNGIKAQNQFKSQPNNIAFSKVPIYSFRMRSGRRFSEKELLDITINPIELNFLPKEFWLTPQTTIKQVIQTFFKARSTKNLRFEHKLWNALILSTHYPELISVLGIYWISIDILKVNRDIFGALINVTKPAAALFNSQGSFLTHGFVEVSKEEALKIHMIKEELVDDVDESVVRLFRHSAGLLKANSHKGDLVTCRWNK